MSTNDIINIVFVVLSIILGFLSIYFKSNSKLSGGAAQLIAKAEYDYKDTISGGQKFQIVVVQLYSLLPAFIRPFIPKAIISAIVQNVFDQISSYANQQLNKAVDSATQYTGKVIDTVEDTAAAENTQTGAEQATQVQQVTAGLGDTAANS